MLILLLHNCVGGAMVFNCLKDSEYGWRGTRVSIFLMAVCDALLGTREGLSDPRPLHNLPGKHNYFKRLIQNNSWER